MTILQAQSRSDPLLAASWEHCRQVTRRAARNFYFGLALLPRAKRLAMFALYAWMRRADDIADADDGRTPQQRLAALEEFWTATCAMLDGHGRDEATPSLWPAMTDTVRRYRIPGRIFEDAIVGHRRDILGDGFATFDDLRDYCDRVAGTVGVASIHIWGFDGGAETERLAVERGVALQLTNILRDLREDAARQRIYLPKDDLARFGVTCVALCAGRCDAAFADLMRFEIARARTSYRRSASLEQRISPDCRAALATMTGIYRGLLDTIEQNPQLVLRRRISLPLLAKLAIAVKAKWCA